MSDNKEKEDKPVVAKTAVDLQRLKLMKLMKNPDKPVVLPERPKAKNTPTVPEFVRNVMGSSAGAGSGEFHVYRHLRRKEYARQKFIQEKGRKETLDEAYHRKLHENKAHADEVTAKKRAKRLKKKQKSKEKKKMKPMNANKTGEEEQEDTTEDECSDKEETAESTCAKSVPDHVQKESSEGVDDTNQENERTDDIKRSENNTNNDESLKPGTLTPTISDSTPESVTDDTDTKSIPTAENT